MPAQMPAETLSPEQSLIAIVRVRIAATGKTVRKRSRMRQRYARGAAPRTDADTFHRACRQQFKRRTHHSRQKRQSTPHAAEASPEAFVRRASQRRRSFSPAFRAFETSSSAAACRDIHMLLPPAESRCMSSYGVMAYISVPISAAARP